MVSEYDEQSIVDNLSTYLDSGICVLIIAEEEDRIVGMTAAVFFQLYMNKSTVMSQELFWWVHPDHRGGAGREMLDRLEYESAQRADCLVMISLHNVQPERVGKLYERRGYKPVEHHYMKVF